MQYICNGHNSDLAIITGFMTDADLPLQSPWEISFSEPRVVTLSWVLGKQRTLHRHFHYAQLHFWLVA